MVLFVLVQKNVPNCAWIVWWATGFGAFSRFSFAVKRTGPVSSSAPKRMIRTLDDFFSTACRSPTFLRGQLLEANILKVCRAKRDNKSMAHVYLQGNAGWGMSYSSILSGADESYVPIPRCRVTRVEFLRAETATWSALQRYWLRWQYIAIPTFGSYRRAGLHRCL